MRTQLPLESKIVLSPFVYQHQGVALVGDAVLVRAPGFKGGGAHVRIMDHLNLVLASMHGDRYDAAMMLHGSSDGRADIESILAVMGAGGSDEAAYHSLRNELRGALTSNPRLCRIEGNDAAVTSNVWNAISETSGVAAVDRVLSVFVAYFFERFELPDDFFALPPAPEGR